MTNTFTMKERNQRLLQRYFEEVWNQDRPDVLDELIAPNSVNHSPGMPDPRLA